MRRSGEMARNIRHEHSLPERQIVDAQLSSSQLQQGRKTLTSPTPGAGRPSFLQPGVIGPVQTSNRIIRAGTGESTAGPDGFVTDQMIELHTALARGGVGVAFSGHMFCHPRGRYGMLQSGINSDEHIPGLVRLTTAVHRQGGLIFCQIGHAGSQSMVPGVRPLAPSAVSNVMTGRHVAGATADEVDEAVAAFASAARRAAESGFDGVHIHGANGYLISEFVSPLTNQRTDRWGGSSDARLQFPLAVVREVRAALPKEFALTMKLGFADLVDTPGVLASMSPSPVRLDSWRLAWTASRCRPTS